MRTGRSNWELRVDGRCPRCCGHHLARRLPQTSKSGATARHNKVESRHPGSRAAAGLPQALDPVCCWADWPRDGASKGFVASGTCCANGQKLRPAEWERPLARSTSGPLGFRPWRRRVSRVDPWALLLSEIGDYPPPGRDAWGVERTMAGEDHSRRQSSRCEISEGRGSPLRMAISFCIAPKAVYPPSRLVRRSARFQLILLRMNPTRVVVARWEHRESCSRLRGAMASPVDRSAGCHRRDSDHAMQQQIRSMAAWIGALDASASCGGFQARQSKPTNRTASGSRLERRV